MRNIKEELLERANEIMKEEYSVDGIRSRQVKAALQAVAEMLELVAGDIDRLTDGAGSL